MSPKKWYNNFHVLQFLGIISHLIGHLYGYSLEVNDATSLGILTTSREAAHAVTPQVGEKSGCSTDLSVGCIHKMA